MAQIKLFSVNGQAGIHNCVDLQKGLKIPFGREASYNGIPYQPTLSVQEIDQIAAIPEDQKYHQKLVDEGKIAHGGQLMKHGAMVDIPAHPDDCARYDKPAIALVGTEGLDPAMILAEMYAVLETNRHKLRDEGHPLGGEAENYVAGIRIANRSVEQRGETAAVEITPTEFKQVAQYMRGELNNDHPIAEKIGEIRETVGYHKEKEAVTLVQDGGTVGHVQNRQR